MCLASGQREMPVMQSLRFQAIGKPAKVHVPSDSESLFSTQESILERTLTFWHVVWFTVCHVLCASISAQPEKQREQTPDTSAPPAARQSGLDFCGCPGAWETCSGGVSRLGQATDLLKASR